MRPHRPTVLALFLALAAAPALAFSEAALIDGFNRTVFGSEYSSWGWQAFQVKKFADPVRMFVDDRTAARRGADVRAFAAGLPRLVDGLELSVVDDADQANFHVFVVDRAEYRRVVTEEIYDRPSSGFAPGKCLVRVVSGRNGISRADAVIVADEGEFLFRRCMTEEILQGLGPVNDDPGLADSVFNDASRHASFTDFDRHILNILYHPDIKPGMTKAEARRALPDVTAAVRRRLGGQ